MSKDRDIDDAELTKVTGAGDEHIAKDPGQPGVPADGQGTKPAPPGGGGGGGGAPDGIDGDADTGGDQDMGSV